MPPKPSAQPATKIIKQATITIAKPSTPVSKLHLVLMQQGENAPYITVTVLLQQKVSIATGKKILPAATAHIRQVSQSTLVYCKTTTWSQATHPNSLEFHSAALGLTYTIISLKKAEAVIKHIWPENSSHPLTATLAQHATTMSELAIKITQNHGQPLLATPTESQSSLFGAAAQTQIQNTPRKITVGFGEGEKVTYIPELQGLTIT